MNNGRFFVVKQTCWAGSKNWNRPRHNRVLKSPFLPRSLLFYQRRHRLAQILLSSLFNCGLINGFSYATLSTLLAVRSRYNSATPNTNRKPQHISRKWNTATVAWPNISIQISRKVGEDSTAMCGWQGTEIYNWWRNDWTHGLRWTQQRSLSQVPICNWFATDLENTQ